MKKILVTLFFGLLISTNAYSDHVPTAPKYLSADKNPTVILFNSPYRKEMIEQIKFVNKNSNIIEC